MVSSRNSESIDRRLDIKYVEAVRRTNSQSNFLLRGQGTNKQLKRLRLRSATYRDRYYQARLDTALSIGLPIDSGEENAERRANVSRVRSPKRIGLQDSGPPTKSSLNQSLRSSFSPNRSFRLGSREEDIASDENYLKMGEVEGPVMTLQRLPSPTNTKYPLLIVHPSTLDFGRIFSRASSSVAVADKRETGGSASPGPPSPSRQLSPTRRSKTQRRLQLERIASFCEKPAKAEPPSLLHTDNKRTLTILNNGFTSQRTVVQLASPDKRIQVDYEVCSRQEKLNLSPGMTMKVHVTILGGGRLNRIRNALLVQAGAYVHSIPITARLVARQVLVEEVEHHMAPSDHELLKRVPRMGQTFWNSKEGKLEWIATSASNKSRGGASRGPLLGHWFDSKLSLQDFRAQVEVREGWGNKPMVEEDSLPPYCFVVHREVRSLPDEPTPAEGGPEEDEAATKGEEEVAKPKRRMCCLNTGIADYLESCRSLSKVVSDALEEEP